MMLTQTGNIGARLDRLPATRSVWTLIGMLSLGGFFEFYDLFFTGYVAPGLLREHILTPTTTFLFGFSGIAGFIAALFAGLFVGTMMFGFVADKLGRRTIFTWSLLWYSAASVIMALQTDATWLLIWRFIAGVGIGVELVTIDTYISEFVPKAIRGRAFAFNQTIQFAVVPVVAFLAYQLVPLDPFGFAGWRWVVMIGSLGALVVWFIRRAVPESPRWLASHGRMADAERIVTELEARVQAEHGAPLPPIGSDDIIVARGRFSEMFSPAYRGRTVMLVIFQIFQTVGFYGFANWVPTLLIQQGITTTSSLAYTFIIAIAAPFGPAAASLLADRIERKWMIVAAAGSVGVFGMLFSQVAAPAALIFCGIMLTMASNIMSFSFHAYQAELYPTRIRAMAVGFVYSFSRLSAVFSAFFIAFFLRDFGTVGVFTFIAGSMVMVMLSIGGFGPAVKDRSLEAISH